MKNFIFKVNNKIDRIGYSIISMNRLDQNCKTKLFEKIIISEGGSNHSYKVSVITILH